jgi:hypothetical protein
MHAYIDSPIRLVVFFQGDTSTKIESLCVEVGIMDMYGGESN